MCAYIKSFRNVPCFALGYIDSLIAETRAVCSEGTPRPSTSETQPKSLSSEYERPEKTSAIVSHKSRFSKL